jgi:hypothetical protein
MEAFSLRFLKNTRKIILVLSRVFSGSTVMTELSVAYMKGHFFYELLNCFVLMNSRQLYTPCVMVAFKQILFLLLIYNLISAARL